MMAGSMGDGNAVEVELDALVNLKLNLEDLQKQMDQLAKYLSDQITNSSKRAVDKTVAEDELDKKQAKIMEDERRKDRSLDIIKNATGTIADVGVGFIKKTFGLVEDIYAKLKAASPLLKTVEDLFNLAWTLFFMPIGNKLAEELIPAVLTMMDDVAELWDAFDGMTLGEAFSFAISEGVRILSGFFISIGDTLEEQGGFVGAIGHTISEIGSLIKNHGVSILNTLLSIAEFILFHIRELVSVIVAFKVSSLAIQAAQLSVQLATYIQDVSQSWNLIGAGVAGVATSGLIAGAATYALTAYADGGYVPATPGGQLAIIGEGGEGEYIVPESKLGQLGGNSYTLNFYGYNDDEFVNRVESVVSNQISQSRLRSGV